jgi:hypothetical protein
MAEEDIEPNDVVEAPAEPEAPADAPASDQTVMICIRAADGSLPDLPGN